MSQRIAFIGLGNMGRPMAANLVKAGYHVSGFDLSDDARRLATELGVPLADSLTAAVEGADVVISMLPASRHVESLYLGDGESSGLIATLDARVLLLDCSTIAPASARTVGLAAERKGTAFLDAPVSGGTGGAAAGTLTFIVGGNEAALERARPVFQAMGKNVFHAGAAGSGQTAKLCNNMLLAILMIGTSEALALGVANGLDPKVLSEIMAKSSGRNWALEVYNPLPGVMENVPASRGYSGGFGTDLMLKDLDLAEEAARASRAATPLGALARNLYAVHSRAGSGTLDFSSIIQLMG